MEDKPFKMKNPSLAKAMKEDTPMQLNYGSPAKIDLKEGLKKVIKSNYDKGKELYGKIPKSIKNTIRDVADPNPYSRLFRVAREQSPTFKELTDKPVRAKKKIMKKGINTIEEMISPKYKHKPSGK